MGTERSKPLHNFTLPCDLRWGNQRFLRCMKVNSGGQISPNRRRADGNSSGSSDHHNHHLPIQQRRAAGDRGRERDGDSSSRWFAGGSSRRFGYDDGGGIAATREKVMLDLQTAADKMRSAFFKDGGGLEEGEVSVSVPRPLPPPPPAASADGEVHRPWNLRTRRAAGRTPTNGPKKRPRTVQKQLDTLFPGLWLTEVTADMYKVPEAAP
ncbi:Protein of unknown function (DUF1639 [Striga hermonthica]|uniref:DUF1639 family protein n=1 Tax=Striga hermonthica TaxID=68872 RepID=A0A9N7NYJ9_STRHE|nr:Protein of unknown function (DUF1639 [Striga hermonthica]